MARRRLLPGSASVDVPRVILARGLRGFADGFVSVVLAVYLTTLGFSPLQIGAIVTGTLLGSAALTLGTGLVAHRWELRTLLLAACVLMTAHRHRIHRGDRVLGVDGHRGARHVEPVGG